MTQTYCTMTIEECEQCPYANSEGDCTVDDSEYNRDLTQIFAQA